MSEAGRNGVATTSATCPPKCTGKSEVSRRVIGAIQERPASNACQKPSTSWPNGVTTPIPVTTTRRRGIPAQAELACLS